MLNLDDTAILKKTLPSSIAGDQTVQDISDSIQPQLNKACLDIASVLLLPKLDTLPEDIVDSLAWQYHVDFYRDSFPLATKRKLVRTAIERHRRKGTPAAVEEIVRTVYKDSIVEEWFEYGGEPYWFRILLTANTAAPLLSMNELLALVEEYKSFRSHLEGVYYHVPHDIVVGSRCSWVRYRNRRCGTYPFRATRGKIDDIDLVVETFNTGIGYRNPYAGEIVAGTFPRSTPGKVSDTDMVVATGTEAAGYRNPYAGEVSAGMFPQTATQGSVEGNGLAAGTSAVNRSYSVRRCGSKPGRLM